MLVSKTSSVIRNAIINQCRSMKTSHKRKNEQNSFKARKSSLAFPTSGLKLSVLAILPIIIACLIYITDTVYEYSPYYKRPRQPYVFDWEEMILTRQSLCSKYNQPVFLPMGIFKRDGLSVAEFTDLWDAKWPIIVTDVVQKWGAYQWSKEFLYKFYSEHNITVIKYQNGRREGSVMSVGDFYRATFDKYSPGTWLYANDEHFISDNPSLKLDIGENEYFEPDYMKLFPENIRPKNSMLLWGTQYSRSNLHLDPYNWTGSLALLKGKKKWKLFPPGQDDILGIKSQPSGYPLDCPHYVSPRDMFSTNKQPKNNKLTSIEVIQNEGELLFIPTGWAHQAYNLEETLAISSQVLNKGNYRTVLEEIITCTDISEQLPALYNTLAPEEQVSEVMNLIPAAILERAEQTNKEMKERLTTST